MRLNIPIINARKKLFQHDWDIHNILVTITITQKRFEKLYLGKLQKLGYKEGILDFLQVFQGNRIYKMLGKNSLPVDTGWDQADQAENSFMSNI